MIPSQPEVLRCQYILEMSLDKGENFCHKTRRKNYILSLLKREVMLLRKYKDGNYVKCKANCEEATFELISKNLHHLLNYDN